MELQTSNMQHAVAMADAAAKPQRKRSQSAKPVYTDAPTKRSSVTPPLNKTLQKALVVQRVESGDQTSLHATQMEVSPDAGYSPMAATSPDIVIVPRFG